MKVDFLDFLYALVSLGFKLSVLLSKKYKLFSDSSWVIFTFLKKGEGCHNFQAVNGREINETNLNDRL